jgi:thioesterase domain-containing protein
MNVAVPLMCRLTSRGALPALDFVPSLGTTPLSLVRLARAIVPERAVRSYAYRGIEDDLPPHPTIEAIAEANVAELRAVAPQGPYLIAGHCLGGAVALAMASALEAGGERVAALVVIDAMAPLSVDHASKVPITSSPGASTRVAHFGEIVQSMSTRAIELMPQLEPDVARRLFSVLRLHLDAGVNYRARPLRAPVHVLRTADGDDKVDGEWKRFTPALKRHPVPGDTLSMLRPPHVEAVGRVLGRLLHEAV